EVAFHGVHAAAVALFAGRRIDISVTAHGERAVEVAFHAIHAAAVALLGGIDVLIEVAVAAGLVGQAVLAAPVAAHVVPVVAHLIQVRFDDPVPTADIDARILRRRALPPAGAGEPVGALHDGRVV